MNGWNDGISRAIAYIKDPEYNEIWLPVEPVKAE